MNNNILVSKIDTKEKMHVIRFEKNILAANMSDAYRKLLLPYLQEPVKNLVLDFSEIQSIDIHFVEEMIRIQSLFYENSASLVVCNLSKEILNFLDDADLADQLNITPTESEAWDIVQMEEIERELL